MLIIAFISLALLTVAAMHYCVQRYGQSISPDGNFYLKLAAGKAVPPPYSLRPLLPLICRDHAGRWNTATFTGAALTAGGIAVMATLKGAELLPAVIAGAAFIPLRVVSIASFLPVLTDTVSLAFIAAIGIADAMQQPFIVAALSVVGAFVSEKIPVFGAALTLSAVPLAGLAVTAALYFRSRNFGATGVEWLDAPLRASLQKHRSFLKQPGRYLHPWGLLLLASLFSFSLPLALSLLLAYAQLFRAQDAVRLIQYAAPAVCVAAAMAMGGIAPELLCGGLFLHWWAAQTEEL